MPGTWPNPNAPSTSATSQRPTRPTAARPASRRARGRAGFVAANTGLSAEVGGVGAAVGAVAVAVGGVMAGGTLRDSNATKGTKLSTWRMPFAAASRGGSPVPEGTTREGGMYQQVYDPVSNSLGASSIFAALPLLTLFILLGGLKMKAHWAGLISLAVALVVAIAVYDMPAGQAFDA